MRPARITPETHAGPLVSYEAIGTEMFGRSRASTSKPHRATKRDLARSGGTRCKTSRLKFFGSCQGWSLRPSKPPGRFAGIES